MGELKVTCFLLQSNRRISSLLCLLIFLDVCCSGKWMRARFKAWSAMPAEQ